MARLKTLELSLLALMLAGCGDDPPKGVVDTDDINTGDGDGDGDGEGDGDGDGDAEEEPCADGDEQACSCAGGGVGTSVCQDEEFGECTGCVAEATEICVPGKYVGEYMIDYWSSASSIWPGVFGPTESKPDKSKVEFNLVKEGTEFITVGNGCFLAEESTDPNLKSSRSQLTGQLDCSTGKLTGIVRGYYAVKDGAGNWVNYFFKGPMEAMFNPKTKSFEQGKYKVQEPPVPLSFERPGGDGVWTATYKSDEVTTSIGECLDIEFPEAMFP